MLHKVLKNSRQVSNCTQFYKLPRSKVVNNLKFNLIINKKKDTSCHFAKALGLYKNKHQISEARNAK